ncbi:MAG: NUDIX hydrolase [Bacteroidetes bacterium]|nr:MAG: NUDIX hydrolase [Bacteroidota bacterium]
MKSDRDQNPWVTLDQKTVYDNPWISVSHRNVLNPAGGKGIYGLVHFKNIAIAIVPLDDELHTWLVGQYRYTLEAYSWEVVEGGGPLDEPVLASAQRELLEETGIRARSWQSIGEFAVSNSVTDERAVVFVAKDLTFGPSSPEDTEALEVRKVPFQQAFEMVMNGEITDMLSATAILKTKYLLDAGKL